MTNKLLLKDFPSGFPEDVQKIIKMIAFDNMKGLNLLGSMALRSQLYAGDYDLEQKIHLKEHSDSEALNKLAKEFKDMIQNLLNVNNLYVGDIKAGTVDEWKVIQDNAAIRHDKVVNYNYVSSMDKLDQLRRSNIISEEEYNESKALLKETPTPKEFLQIQKNIKYNVVRWKPQDVINGYVTLRNNKRMTIAEAFNTPIIAKLDVVGFVSNYRYTDFSVIYHFYNNDKELNPQPIDIENSLKTNILLYCTEDFYFKACKRMFALSKYKMDKISMNQLFNILNDPQLGLVYMVYGDIGTILWILEHEKHISYERLEFEIDQFKNKLSNIYKMSDYLKREPIIFKLIDESKKGRNKAKLMIELNKLADELSDILNHYCINEMKEKNLYPVDAKKFFP
jgi:hypothetical protein